MTVEQMMHNDKLANIKLLEELGKIGDVEKFLKELVVHLNNFGVQYGESERANLQEFLMLLSDADCAKVCFDLSRQLSVCPTCGHHREKSGIWWVLNNSKLVARLLGTVKKEE